METTDPIHIQQNLDIIWIIISAGLVMFMQTGFTAFESGCTQAKNTINVAIKNVTDFIVAILAFAIVGYGFMFGASESGIIGTDGFFLNTVTVPHDYAMFVFQATFAGTAATIISGAIAERMQFFGYVVVSLLVTTLVYPVSGHWIWNGDGWLAQSGFIDFAGSTVVHSLGAWVGLAGAILIGPRVNRFCEEGKVNPIKGHSLVLAMVGVFILFFGWFGFNGGSTLTGDASVAKIVANTMLAAAASGISCFIVSLIRTQQAQIEKMLNGIIGGLVCITASCHLVEPSGAIILGLSTGVIVYAAEWFLLHVLKVDDPIHVVAAHGVAGFWGTVMLSFFAPADALVNGSALSQAGAQLQGCLAVLIWGLGTGFIIFGILKAFNVLRVPPEGERMGLNIYEHGATTGFFDTLKTMEQIAQAHNGGSGDLTKRVNVEVGCESGDLAHVFNQLMLNFHDTIATIKRDIDLLHSSADDFKQNSEHLQTQANYQSRLTEQSAHALNKLSETVSDVAEHSFSTAKASQNISDQANSGRSVVKESSKLISELAAEIDRSAVLVEKVSAESNNIQNIIEMINGISEQTNLLALNASIEAARAGDAGRGFAVVADEVRQLASKTQNATEQIQKMLTVLTKEVSHAVKGMSNSSELVAENVKKASEADEVLSLIAGLIDSIHSQNENIASATQEQQKAIKDIDESMEQLQTISSQTADKAESVSTNSSQITEVANELYNITNSFKVEDKAA